MSEKKKMTQAQAALKKRTMISSLIIILLIPATIATGMKFGQSRYMIVSVLILIYTMAPFFMVFERRKPKAREVVLIAMMSALTVVLQVFFHTTLPLQIGTAMVIVSGISLGPEAGFLIGAISRFVCNFYMGQGSWTPWQMFCWGLLGFLAGLCFNRNQNNQLKERKLTLVMGPVISVLFAIMVAYVCYLIMPGSDETFLGWRLYAFGFAGLIVGALIQRKRLSADGITLALFTFFVTFIIYGGIMNICAMVTSAGMPGGNAISLESLKVLYITGVPYDLYHAGTAALCVFLFGDSIIKKLERIKIKYGIYK